MNEGVKTNMIYDYFRWIWWPKLTYRKVEPIESISKEFPMEKQDQDNRQPEHKQKKHEPGQRLSIWVQGDL